MVRSFIAFVAVFAALCTAASAQGPGPPPSAPWTYASPLISAPSGNCVGLPNTVTGGCVAPNSVNVSGNYYVNGVAIAPTTGGATGQVLQGVTSNPPVWTGSPTLTTSLTVPEILAPSGSPLTIRSSAGQSLFLGQVSNLLVLNSTGFEPVADSAIQLGGAGNRWTNVYSVLATIPLLTAPSSSNLSLNAPTGQIITFTVNSVQEASIATAGAFTVGVPGTQQGSLIIASPTANSMTLTPASSASGTATIPSGTYTLAGTSLANIFTAAQTINLNATALGASQSGTALLIGNADAAITRIQLDSFANVGGVSCVRSDGTNASPTALQNNDQICAFNAWGYDGTAISATSEVSMEMYAAQNWSVGSHGTYIQISTTPNGSVTRTPRITFGNDGGLLVPPGVTGGSQGAGTINAAGLFVNGVGVSLRTQLTGNRVYYVNGNFSTTAICGPAGAFTCSVGNDSNNGLAITTPFLTLQHAYAVINAGIDFAYNYTVIVYLAHNVGTTNYNLSCAAGPIIGQSVFQITGDSSSQNATVITDPASGTGLAVKDGCTVGINYVEFVDNGSNNAAGHIAVGGTGNAGHIDWDHVTLAAMTIGTMVSAGNMGSLTANGAGITISGGAPIAVAATNGGLVDFGSQTVTVSGTPAFSTAFGYILNGGVINATSSTFSGAATGTRCQINGPFNVSGFNCNAVFPGNADGVQNEYIGAIGLQSGTGGSSTFAYGTAGHALLSGGGATAKDTWDTAGVSCTVTTPAHLTVVAGIVTLCN